MEEKMMADDSDDEGWWPSSRAHGHHLSHQWLDAALSITRLYKANCQAAQSALGYIPSSRARR
jgi:hypothetical protein